MQRPRHARDRRYSPKPGVFAASLYTRRCNTQYRHCQLAVIRPVQRQGAAGSYVASASSATFLALRDWSSLVGLELAPCGRGRHYVDDLGRRKSDQKR
jgi:hypothetical protein